MTAKFRHTRLLLSITIAVLSLSLALLITNPSWAMKIHRKIFPASPELRAFYHEMVSYQLRVDRNIPANAHLFVGDSTIQSLCTSCITPLAINFGIGRDTTLGVIQRLRRYSALSTARSLFLSVGVNDFKYRTPAEVTENVQKIVALAPQESDVIINALWPVNPTISTRWQGYPEKIDTLNKALKEICLKRPRCHYFDITAMLKNEDGYLKKELQIGDGIHLNGAGNQIVIDQLRGLYETLEIPTD